MPKPPQNNTTFTSLSFARLIQPETVQMHRLEVEFRRQNPLRRFFQRVMSGQLRSCSETTVATNGHAILKKGSSNRVPRATLGV